MIECHLSNNFQLKVLTCSGASRHAPRGDTIQNYSSSGGVGSDGRSAGGTRAGNGRKSQQEAFTRLVLVVQRTLAEVRRYFVVIRIESWMNGESRIQGNVAEIELSFASFTF